MYVIKEMSGNGFSTKQKFISIFKAKSSEFSSASKFYFKEIVKNDRRSVVGFIDPEMHCLKLIKPLSWHEYFRILWGHSRVQKEIRGNKLLRKIGLYTPEIISHGMGVFSLKEYDFLGYIVMENLYQKKYQEVFCVFQNDNISGATKDKILDMIVVSMLKMKVSRMLFSDLHLKNIMINENNKLAFIDTGISYFSFVKTFVFRKKYNQSVDKLLHCHEGNNGLTDVHKKKLQSTKF